MIEVGLFRKPQQVHAPFKKKSTPASHWWKQYSRIDDYEMKMRPTVPMTSDRGAAVGFNALLGRISRCRHPWRNVSPRVRHRLRELKERRPSRTPQVRTWALGRAPTPCPGPESGCPAGPGCVSPRRRRTAEHESFGCRRWPLSYSPDEGNRGAGR